jgi:hypothetical protein
MNPIPAQYRQGDLLIEQVHTLPRPTELVLVESGILQKGEVTGHAHRLDLTKGQGRVLEDERHNIYLSILTPTPLIHEEHGTIVLPEGLYQVIRQREFDENAIRFVYD